MSTRALIAACLVVILAGGTSLLLLLSDDSGRGSSTTEPEAKGGAALPGGDAELVSGADPVAGDAQAKDERRAIANTTTASDAGAAADPATWVPWRGRVLALRDGAPIEGASVTLSADGIELTDFEASTGADGSFEVRWDASRAVVLTISHGAYVDRREARPELVDGAEFHLVESARVTGIIEPWPPAGADGMPLDTLAILTPHDQRRRLEGERPGTPVQDDGSFEFTEVDPGVWNVAVSTSDAVVEERAGIELSPGEHVDLRLRAELGARIDGEIRARPSGAAVAGAVLESRPLRTNAPDEVRDVMRSESVSDDAGRFALTSLAAGPHSIEIELPWGQVLTRRVNISETREPVRLDLEVEQPARLSGRVVDAGEAPVAGARVMLLERGDAKVLSRALKGREIEPTVETDEDGAFAFDAAPTGERFTVLAIPREGASGSLALGPLDPASLHTDVLLRLPAGARLEGRVHDAEDPRGAIPVGAEVELRAVHQSASGKVATTMVNEDGSFVFEHAPTTAVVLTVEAEGYRPARRRVVVPANGLRDVELMLDPSFVIAGRVALESGAAVAGVAVRLTIDPQTPEAAAMKAAGGRGMKHLDFTDAYGRFRFDRVPRGRWLATVHSSDYVLPPGPPIAIQSPGEGELLLTVVEAERQAPGVIAGEVWPADGGPLLGLRIDGLGRGSALSTRGTRFEASGVRAGRVRLQFRADGYVPESRGPLQLLPGARLELGRIDLIRGFPVTVRVQDPDGKRLDGAKVVLRARAVEDGGPTAGAGNMKLKSIGKGRYRSVAVPVGSWRAKVTRKGFQSATKTIEVRENDSGDVRIQLKPREAADAPAKQTPAKKKAGG